MKRLLASIFSVALLLPSFALAAANLPLNVTTATVLIANYDDDNVFLGWGSGFFVDEGIVVTNKHVIEGGDWYRVYATGADDKVDFLCYKRITRSDVKINLDDDVAYMRVFLNCDHGIMRFASDPVEGDSISVVGYPYEDSAEASTELTVTTGTVIGQDEDGWLLTDAHMDVGNSGGPVVDGTEVLGVAVAKGIDTEGNFLNGYFIPSSVIYRGLLYANDSGFGYTPQTSFSSRSRSSSSSSSSSSSVSSMQSRSSSSSRSSLSSRRSSSSSSERLSPAMRTLKLRTCARVEKNFKGNKKMMDRVNERLQKRFGFVCR